MRIYTKILVKLETERTTELSRIFLPDPSEASMQFAVSPNSSPSGMQTLFFLLIKSNLILQSLILYINVYQHSCCMMAEANLCGPTNRDIHKYI